MWRRSALLCFLAAAFFMCRSLAPAGDDEAFALKGAKVLTGGDRNFEDGCVIVKGSKIVSVGPAKSIPEGIRVIDLGCAVLCPGLIDLYTALGAEKDTSEPASALQPAARLVDVFDPSDEDFEQALCAGITSVLIAPSPENVIGGSAACVKTWGDTPGHRVLMTEGPLFMTVAPSCYKRDREPTSRMGALDLLRRTLETAASGGGKNPLADLIRGRVQGFFVAHDRYDIEAGLTLSRDFDIRMVFVGATGADKVLEDLEERPVPMILGPYDFSTAERVLKVPSAVAACACPIAFTAGSPARDPTGLRITASVAVQAGLSREVALKALTSQAAAIGGIAGRVGTLAPGMDADIAVFSGHPVDLSARLLCVYVDGRQAFKACDSCIESRGETK
jgi:imidazolonepropionase-like amidohydrolase